ncbi:sulfite exporter TauE/SafE family protein [Aureitalea sp. L0-47]|uniref:sulfite exporter TauE/SafE family protein n=1 Tax=Aureitalea sp. L0-47 TaxID=2816962 RepID=UPI0022371D75|nr:sulfite exporter TauE/SafE family protein [Aureitalea sp. L0-47]MCW5520095.1 sulfite exporter TauE/SafE family protein [Aureitalea sp. L0-47]
MLWSGFILGLLGSFHCVGMCGPIAFVLPLDRKSRSKRMLQVSLYHLGRIITYSLIGLLFGLLGRGLYLFGLQQKISVITGILMILAVVLAATSIRKFRFSAPLYKAISGLKNKLGAALKKKSPDTFLTIGFLNGFLPCGLVYMAVFGAIAAGDLFQSSLYMVLFGLGTIPLMTTAVYFGNFLTGKIRHRIRKVIPVFVVIVGVLFILRGLGLGIPYISPKPMSEKVDAEMECHTSISSEKIIHYNS